MSSCLYQTSLTDSDSLAALRTMLSNPVVSPHTKRAYLASFDDLIKLAAGRPISRMVLMEYRASMVAEGLSAATINQRLCAIRKLVNEAQENGLIDPAEAVRLTSVPGVPQNGVRLGTWLTKEETRRLLAAVDRTELIGKRNFAILSNLCHCGLRRDEAAKVDSTSIQLREGRWVVADLVGKRGRVRTVSAVTMESIAGFSSASLRSAMNPARSCGGTGPVRISMIASWLTKP